MSWTRADADAPMPTLRVVHPGLQTTIQAGPRRAHRHLGVPTGGAADFVSSALANRLVGNASGASVLEVTLGSASFVALREVVIAIAGAPCEADASSSLAPFHHTFALGTGRTLALGRPLAGCRTYVAVAGGFVGEEAFGSASTYLAGGFGGFGGRALRAGDEVAAMAGAAAPLSRATPASLRAPFAGRWALRTVLGPEADALGTDDRKCLFGEAWRASRACDRTGVRLEGPSLGGSGDPRMDSVAVLPGTIQLPPGGAPIVLGVDGGTTGGYPRVAQVVRADRHLIGQIRPGDPVRLLAWQADDARAALAGKTRMLRDWLGADFAL